MKQTLAPQVAFGQGVHKPKTVLFFPGLWLFLCTGMLGELHLLTWAEFSLCLVWRVKEVGPAASVEHLDTNGASAQSC